MGEVLEQLKLAARWIKITKRHAVPVTTEASILAADRTMMTINPFQQSDARASGRGAEVGCSFSQFERLFPKARRGLERAQMVLMRLASLELRRGAQSHD